MEFLDLLVQLQTSRRQHSDVKVGQPGPEWPGEFVETVKVRAIDQHAAINAGNVTAKVCRYLLERLVGEWCHSEQGNQ